LGKQAGLDLATSRGRLEDAVAAGRDRIGEEASVVLDPAREREAADLLAAGRLSQRAIGREAKVSRGTVGAMASGRREPDLSRRAAAKKLAAESHDVMTVPGEAKCSNCGVQITFRPCHACRIRLLLYAAGHRAPPPEPDEPLTLALRDEDLASYEGLRAQKVAELIGGVPEVDRPDLDALEPTVEELRRIEAE